MTVSMFSLNSLDSLKRLPQPFSLISTTLRWVDRKWFPLIEITRNHQKSLEIKKSEISLFSLGFHSTPFCSTNISVSRTLKLFFWDLLQSWNRVRNTLGVYQTKWHFWCYFIQSKKHFLKHVECHLIYHVVIE
jgi:hypothetical protein